MILHDKEYLNWTYYIYFIKEKSFLRRTYSVQASWFPESKDNLRYNRIRKFKLKNIQPSTAPSGKEKESRAVFKLFGFSNFMTQCQYINYKFTVETVKTFKQERFVSIEDTFLKSSKRLFLDLELWLYPFNLILFHLYNLCFYCLILKWEELTLIKYASKSVPKVFLDLWTILYCI